MKFELYKDGNNQWRWRLKAANGRIIADSAEAYVNRQDCVNGIKLVQDSADAPIIEI